MRKQLFTICLCFVVVTVLSCSDSCKGIDCLLEDSFSFNIRSGDNGKDLVFGEEPQLAGESIEVFYFISRTRKTAEVLFESERAVVPLERDVSEYYIRAMQITDTVQVQVTKRASSECCPSTSVIEAISVNGEMVNGKNVIDLYR